MPIGVGLEAWYAEVVATDGESLLLIVHGVGEPCPTPLWRGKGEHHLIHHLEASHDGEQMVGVLHGGVAFPCYYACGRVVA